MALKILDEFNLIEKVSLNEVPFYKIKKEDKTTIQAQFSVDAEILKYKRNQLTTYESLLRQIKLLQSIRLSGEEDKLIELIDKWETVTKDAVKELFNQQTGGIGSLKKFVKRLGLNYEDLGFSDESEEEGDEEVYNNENQYGDNNENQYNNNENNPFSNYNQYDNNDTCEYKKIKYED